MQREIGIIIRVKEAAIAKQQIKQIVDKQILDHLKKFNFGLQESGDSVGRLGNKAAQASGGLDKFFKTAMKGAGILYTMKRGLSLAMTSFEEGAGLERAAVQFETSIGRINEVLPSLRAATRGTVDDMKLLSTANRAVMEGLKPKELTRLYQMATVASRKLGLESEQAIQTISNAVTRQDESALTTLGTILKMNIGLKVQNALIAKNGGVMSGAMAIQIRQAVIMGELNKKFGGFNDLQEDSVEILQKFRASVGNLRMAIGQALGSALAPMIKALTMAADAAAQFLMAVKDNAAFKTFIQYAASLAVVFSAKGLIGGIVMAAKHLGLFIGGLKMAAILAGAFIGFKLIGGDLKDLAAFAEKTKTVFSVLFQLLSNYDSETGMTSVLTKDKEALGSFFTVVFQAAKIFLVAKAAITGLFKGMAASLSWVKPLLGSFGGILEDVLHSLSSGEPLLQSTINGIERLGLVIGKAIGYAAQFLAIIGTPIALLMAIEKYQALRLVIGEMFGAGLLSNMYKFFTSYISKIAFATQALWGMATANTAAMGVIGLAVAGTGAALHYGNEAAESLGLNKASKQDTFRGNTFSTAPQQAPEMRAQNVDFIPSSGEDVMNAMLKTMNRVAESNEAIKQSEEQRTITERTQSLSNFTTPAFLK